MTHAADRSAQRARYKVGQALLTNYAYVMVGGTVLPSFLGLTAWNLHGAVALGWGIAFHGLALYIAPRSET